LKVVSGLLSIQYTFIFSDLHWDCGPPAKAWHEVDRVRP
jgi:hypothetical protein